MQSAWSEYKHPVHALLKMGRYYIATMCYELGHVSNTVSILFSKLSDCPNTNTLLCYWNNPFLTVWKCTDVQAVFEAIMFSLGAPQSVDWEFIVLVVSVTKNPFQSFVSPLDLLLGEKGIPIMCTAGSTDPPFFANLVVAQCHNVLAVKTGTHVRTHVDYRPADHVAGRLIFNIGEHLLIWRFSPQSR